MNRTATALGIYLPTDIFCLISANNITWYDTDWSSLSESMNLFTCFKINEKALFMDKSYIPANDDQGFGANYNEIFILQEKKCCILDWDTKTSITNVALLSESCYTLSLLNQYLYLQKEQLISDNKILLQDNKALLHDNKVCVCVISNLDIICLMIVVFQMLTEYGINWIWQSIIDTIIAKLRRCAKNNKKQWESKFKHIPPIIITTQVLCFDHQYKGNKTINLNLSLDKNSFNTKKNNGKCPSFLFDSLLNKGQILLIKREIDKTLFRYYKCYIQYKMSMGIFTIGSKLKYKTINVHQCWQK